MADIDKRLNARMKAARFTPGRLFVIVILLLLLAGAIRGAMHVWSQVTGAPISLAGQIAFVIGAILTIALGGGLMALSFYSARSGRDDEAQYQPHKKKGDS